MNLKSILSPFILTFFLFSYSVAQTSSPIAQPTEEEKKAQQDLEKMALTLLNEILDSAQLLKLPENRSYVYATAADLLWKHDEKRARIFFQTAMNDLALALKDTSSEVANRGDSLWILIRQREQILTSVARRDPQFALDLLQSTRQAFKENQPLWGSMMNQELMLEQAIITEVATSDPKRALQMAQESLAKGVTYQSLTLLRKFQSKDSEAATTFAGDIVKKLRSMDFSKNRDAFVVGQSLLRMLLQPERMTANKQTNSSAKKAKPLTLDEQTTRDLIDMVVTAALNASSERYELMSFQSLLPELEKRVPERVAQLRKKLAESNEAMDPTMKLMMQYQMLMHDGKPEAILEAAAKAPPDIRAHLYQSAASKLMESGDLEGARKVVVDHMGGTDRDQFLASLDQKLISRALEQEKMEEARKLIERITPNVARLAQIANMATSMFAKGDRKMALALLDETEELVNRAPENQQEITAMLKVASAYALIEPGRAFGIFEPVIEQANALLAAAAVLEKFGGEHTYFENGEFRMQVSMEYSWRFSSQFQKEMASLAHADFARTRALADRFQRDEARTMARLLVAQAVLADRPEAGSTAK